MSKLHLLTALLIFAQNLFAQDSKNIEVVVQKGHIQPITALAFHPSGNYYGKRIS